MTVQTIQLIECGDNGVPKLSVRSPARFASAETPNRATFSTSAGDEIEIALVVISDEVERANHALEQQVSMVNAMQDWHAIGDHEHPQLTSEADD